MYAHLHIHVRNSLTNTLTLTITWYSNRTSQQHSNNWLVNNLLFIPQLKMKSTKVQTLGAVHNMYQLQKGLYVCNNQLQHDHNQYSIIQFARAHNTCDGEYTEGACC